MKFRCFKYSAASDLNFDDLNQFLATHRIVGLSKDWVVVSGTSVLVFVLEYTDVDPGTLEGRTRGKDANDAMRGLNDSQVALYNRLRDVRKAMAEALGVPIWTLFSNQMLRGIVLAMPKTLEELAGVPGVGKEKAEKNGKEILEAIRDTQNAKESRLNSEVEGKE